MRSVFLILVLTLFPISHATTATAAGYCPSQKDGKCPQKKKISKKRSDFTEVQRAKFMESARAICTKKYGASSRVHRLDYAKWTVICEPPGY